MIRRDILRSKINTYVGGFFIFSFGLFALTIGFRAYHMVNPIQEAFAAQAGALDN